MNSPCKEGYRAHAVAFGKFVIEDGWKFSHIGDRVYIWKKKDVEKTTEQLYDYFLKSTLRHG